MSEQVLAASSAIPQTVNAWFPILEDNQGFLSLVALILALIFALLEQWRANRADRRQLERTLKVADEVLNAVAILVNKRLADEFPTSTPICLCIDRALPVLQVALGNGGNSADSAMTLADAAEVLRTGRGTMDSEPADKVRVSNFAARLRQVLSQLEQCKKSV